MYDTIEQFVYLSDTVVFYLYKTSLLWPKSVFLFFWNLIFAESIKQKVCPPIPNPVLICDWLTLMVGLTENWWSPIRLK